MSSFVLFPKPRSQVNILMYRNWSIAFVDFFFSHSPPLSSHFIVSLLPFLIFFPHLRRLVRLTEILGNKTHIHIYKYLYSG